MNISKIQIVECLIVDGFICSQFVLVFVNIFVIATCAAQPPNDDVDDPDFAFSYTFDVYVTTPMVRSLNLTEKVQEYCYSKYLIAEGIINTTIYEINVNPFGIDGSKVNCTGPIEVMRELKYNLIRNEVIEKLQKEGISLNKTGCILNQYHNHNYADEIMKIANLARIYITDDQKREERSRFIAMMNSIEQEKKKCLSSDDEQEYSDSDEQEDNLDNMAEHIDNVSAEIPEVPTEDSDNEHKSQIIESTTVMDESATIFQIIKSSAVNIHCTRNTFATILFSFAILNSLISI